MQDLRFLNTQRSLTLCKRVDEIPKSADRQSIIKASRRQCFIVVLFAVQSQWMKLIMVSVTFRVKVDKQFLCSVLPILLISYG